jgi:Protein of unknown function (DUF2490)
MKWFVAHSNQYWLGYMTSTRLSNKYSLWNDLHFVPEGFGIVRTGLTRSISDNVSVTGGYAYLWLPAKPGASKLERHEHRPWAQLQLNVPLQKDWSLIQRIRYDARFRENTSGGEITDGHSFVNRVRLLVSIKKLLGNAEGVRPYAGVSNEILLNFGKEVTTNTFDQNRLSIFVGLQQRNTQYQLGLMNRFVQTSQSSFILNHTVVVWVIQKFDLTKMLDRKHHDTTSE